MPVEILRKEKFIENKFGYCCYVFDQEVKNETYAEIYNLFVYSEFRRQGNAKELLQSVIDTVRSTGYIGEIRIESVPKENSISLKALSLFYRHMGLKVYERHSESKKDGE